MSKRKSNKKIKQQIISYLNRNNPLNQWGYYSLINPKTMKFTQGSYLLRFEGRPASLNHATYVSNTF